MIKEIYFAVIPTDSVIDILSHDEAFVNTCKYFAGWHFELCKFDHCVLVSYLCTVGRISINIIFHYLSKS